MKKKVCVYTCITGNYDELKEIDNNLIDKDIDYYCFTNNKNIKSKTWNVVYIEDFSLSNHMLNRKIKMLGHETINNDYDVLVWLDGNILLKKKISVFLKEQCNLDKYPFVAFKHPDRDCIYDEAIACIKLKKDKKEIIEKQMEFYRKDRYPKHAGLCEMSIFIRKTNDSIVNETMSLWYEMINKYSKRDQLSFMWCVKKKNMMLQQIPLNISNNKYFSKVEHFKFRSNNIKCYRLYFGDSDDFLMSKVVDGNYKINNEIYKIENVKIPNDTSLIEYEVCDLPGVIFDDLKVDCKGFKKFEALNFYHLHIWDIFFDSRGKIKLYGNFKKGDVINISVCLKILNMEQVIDIANVIEETGNTNIENLKIMYKKEIDICKTQLNEMSEECIKVKSKLNDLEEELASIKTNIIWIIKEKIRKKLKKVTK